MDGNALYKKYPWHTYLLNEKNAIIETVNVLPLKALAKAGGIIGLEPDSGPGLG
jgi:hypothetical protein